MRLKIVTLIAATALLVACGSDPKDSGASSGSGSGMGTGGQYGSNQIRPGSAEDLRVNVGDRVFFGYDRSDITPEGRATLDRQAAWLKQYGNVTITIEGHCDERGTREYNIGLGNRRATAVKNYLTALGVSPARVNTISYGKEHPEVVGADDQNRRGVTTVN